MNYLIVIIEDSIKKDDQLFDSPVIQVLIGEYYYRMGVVLIPEIEFFAMMADIKETLKSK